MVAKKKYYKQKLEEKKIEIIKTIIEEEIDLFVLEDSEYHGLNKLRDPNTFVGMLGSLVTPIGSAIAHGATKMGVQLAGNLGLSIAGSVAALIPFSNPRSVEYVAKKIQYWEQENLKKIDRQFEKELAEMWRGWETFKTDFWGIGFIYSPMSAIAAIATAGKGIDMGLSVLNVISAGGVEKIINSINEEITDPGTMQNFLTTGIRRKSSEEEEEDRHIKSYREFQKHLRQQRGQSSFSNNILEEGFFKDTAEPIKQYFGNSKKEKTGIESLNELNQKIENWVKEGKIKAQDAKLFFQKIKNNILKDPEVNQSAQKWSVTNVFKITKNIFANVNNDIITGKAGNIPPQEIEAYKSMGSKFVSNLFGSTMKKITKFKIIPNQAAIKAAEQAVTASMAQMPNAMAQQVPNSNAAIRTASQPNQVQTAQQRPTIPTPIAPQTLPRR